jgi:xanthine dehydrogenase YagR molybdenum-binding subunit
VRPFEYERAADVGGAVARVADRPDAAFLAGGTNLVDHMKLGIASPGLLVDITGLHLGAIEPLPGGGVRIGALVRNSELAADPVIRQGNADAALAAAPVSIDATYTTPAEYHNPIEPHTTVAIWGGAGGAGHLTVYDSNQGASRIQEQLAAVFGLDPGQVTVIFPYVGGAFGAKSRAKAHQVAAGLAAQRAAGRPVKLALTRGQMFAVAGYRTPTIQRVQLGAHTDGRLIAIAHDAIAQTARFKEFAEQTALGTRTMYAAPHRRTTHRLAALDVAVPTIMRAPGEAPGMFALESAVDELAAACGVDPVELRLRNEPGLDPETGLPYSTRNLAACLREGMRRFGWSGRDPAPRARLADGWLAGTGRRRHLPGLSPPRGLARDHPRPGRRQVPGADRGRRHRHRSLDRPDPDCR